MSIPIPSPSRLWRRGRGENFKELGLITVQDCTCICGRIAVVVGCRREGLNTQCRSRARSRARAAYGGEGEAKILKSWAKSQFRTVPVSVGALPLLTVDSDSSRPLSAGMTQCQSRARATYGGEGEAKILKSWAKSQFRTVRWCWTRCPE